jgi:hypothetical protein
MPQTPAHDVTSVTAVSHISSLISQTASTISGASSSESASILQVTRATSRDADASQEKRIEPRSPSVDPALFISALSPSPRRHGNTPNERALARGARILESADASIGSISGSDDSDSEHKAPLAVPSGGAKAAVQPAASPLEDVYEDDGEFDVDSGSASKSSGESVAIAPLPLAASSSASIGSLALSSGERFGSSGGFSGDSGAPSATSAATARARDIAAAHAARMALLRKDDVPDSPDFDDSPSNVMSAIEIYKARAANVRRLAPTSFGDPRRAELSPTSDDGGESDDNF